MSNYSAGMADYKNHYLTQIPDDTVSRLAWSTTEMPLLLAASSWDSTCRIYRIGHNTGSDASLAAYMMRSELAVAYRQEMPLLTCTFSHDTSRLFTGGCNQKAMSYDLASNSPTGTVVGSHDKAVCGVHWVSAYNLVATASWDGKVALWDGRQPNAVWSEALAAKIFTSDVKDKLLTVGDNMGRIYTWDLERVRQYSETKTVTNSLLRTQIRSMSLFPDTTNNPGVALGSICGRCAVMWFKSNAGNSNFSFKCHRIDQHKTNGAAAKATLATCINGIDFHTAHSTFLTGGNDGVITVWDKDNRARLRQLGAFDCGIVALKLHSQTNLLAFATGYDWHMGLDRNLILNTRKSIGIMRLKDEDFKSSKTTFGSRR